MSQIHEPGEAWHVGWDWHVGMWFVEPPFDIELDEPMKWYHDRSKAFAFVDKQIREQPLHVDVVEEIMDESQTSLPVPERNIIRHEDNPLLPPYVPKAQRQPEPEPEPIRVLNENAADRVSDYASRVGLG